MSPTPFSDGGAFSNANWEPASGLRGFVLCYLAKRSSFIGCEADGIPDFHALTTDNNHGSCAWCFDLMMINGMDVRQEPLEHRRERLQALLANADGDLLRFSESFDDPVKLLEAAVKLGLEGIVSKRRD